MLLRLYNFFVIPPQLGSMRVGYEVSTVQRKFSYLCWMYNNFKLFPDFFVPIICQWLFTSVFQSPSVAALSVAIGRCWDSLLCSAHCLQWLPSQIRLTCLVHFCKCCATQHYILCIWHTFIDFRYYENITTTIN